MESIGQQSIRSAESDFWQEKNNVFRCLFSENKEIMKQIREEALKRHEQKEKERSEAKSTLLNNNKREAVREHMKVANFVFSRWKLTLNLFFRSKKKNEVASNR